MSRQRSLGHLAPGERLVDHDLPAVAEQVRGAGEDLLDVATAQMSFERIARGPPFNEREPPGVIGTPVQRMEDAAFLSVGGFE